MTLASLDLETWALDLAIHPAPPIVCCSWQVDGEAPQIAKGAQDAVVIFCRLLKQGHDIGGANFMFDLGCLCAAEPAILPKVFQALADGRLHDVQLLERLHDIGRGTLDYDPITGAFFKYSLAALEQRYFGRDRTAQKESGWRLRYHELEDVPLVNWPLEARDYPLDDARGTLDLLKLQLGGHDRLNVQCEPQEMRAAWALKLMSLRGIRTDPDTVAQVAGDIEKAFQESRQKFMQHGFVEKRRPKGGKDPEVPDGYDPPPTDPALLKKVAKTLTPQGVPYKYAVKKAPIAERVMIAYDNNPPRTPKDGVCCDNDALSESGDEVLEEWAELGIIGTQRSTFIPTVKRGTMMPIHCSFNSLLETQRCSCRDPNLQNLPRGGAIRSCFCARHGFVYLSTDVGGIESITLAQICFEWFGYSSMRDALNAGQDLHVRLAARVLGITYEEGIRRKKAGDPELKRVRQAMKEVNFGLPGLMGPPTLVMRGRHNGIRFCEAAGQLAKCGSQGKTHQYYGRPISPTCSVCLDLAIQYRRLFFEEWPEVVEYHRVTNAVAKSGQPTESTGQGKFLRLEKGPGAVANHYFQNRAAIWAKDATWRIQRAYLDPTVRSMLFGLGAGVLFVHDEVISEVLEDRASECGVEQSKMFVEVGQEHCPDVRITAPPALCRRLLKDMEAVWVNDRLVPWEPRQASG